MNFLDLIFGTERKRVAELESLLNNSQDELTKLDEQNRGYVRQVQDMGNTITEQHMMIADLQNKNSELNTENDNYFIKLKTLQEHQIYINAENNEKVEELDRITERIQQIINGSLRVDFIWRDKGYLIQLHPDSKVDSNYPVLRDRVNVEMANAKYLEVQEINNRTFFIKVKS